MWIDPFPFNNIIHKPDIALWANRWAQGHLVHLFKAVCPTKYFFLKASIFLFFIIVFNGNMAYLNKAVSVYFTLCVCLFFSGHQELKNVQLWLKGSAHQCHFYPVVQSQWKRGGTNITNRHILLLQQWRKPKYCRSLSIHIQMTSPDYNNINMKNNAWRNILLVLAKRCASKALSSAHRWPFSKEHLAFSAG